MANPYQASNLTTPNNPKPLLVSIFGVLHITLSLGAFSALIYGMSLPGGFRARLFQEVLQSSPDVSLTDDSLKVLQDLFSLGIYLEVATLVLASMLLTSGLALLLNARWALSLSNCYSALSISAKAAMLILLVIQLPSLTSFFQGISGGNPNELDFLFLQIRRGVVWGPLVAMLYPLASLYFLNRPEVRAYRKRL